MLAPHAKPRPTPRHDAFLAAHRPLPQCFCHDDSARQPEALDVAPHREDAVVRAAAPCCIATGPLVCGLRRRVNQAGTASVIFGA